MWTIANSLLVKWIDFLFFLIIIFILLRRPQSSKKFGKNFFWTSKKRHPSEIGRNIIERETDDFSTFQHYSVIEPNRRAFGTRDTRGMSNPAFLGTFKGPNPYATPNCPNSPQLKNIPNSLESSDDSSFYSTADLSMPKPKK